MMVRIGAVRIVAAGVRSFESLIAIEAEAGDALIAGFELHQHFRQAGIAGGAGDHAYVRRAVEDLFAFLLRHAA